MSSTSDYRMFGPRPIRRRCQSASEDIDEGAEAIDEEYHQLRAHRAKDSEYSRAILVSGTDRRFDNRSFIGRTNRTCWYLIVHYCNVFSQLEIIKHNS